MCDKDFMPAGFSRRSILRRVSQTVREDLVASSIAKAKEEDNLVVDVQIENTLNDVPANSDVDDTTIADIVSGVTHPTPMSTQSLPSFTSIGSELESAVDWVQESSENDNESCISVKPDDSTLALNLTEWALHHNISHSSLRGLLAVLKPSHPGLPIDPRTLLKTPKNYSMKTFHANQGQYYHFGVQSGIRQHLHLCGNPVMLQFNIDGLPLFKSSATELWPILCLIKGSKCLPFVVGVYCGRKKPADLNEYLNDFVRDLNELLTQGIVFNDVHYSVVIDCFVCDAPARAYLKNVKLHSGYSGCEKCIQEGEYVDGKVTFPQTDASLRTDEDFHNMSDEDHHNGPTPLSSLNIGLVTSFALDYMHLVCLGVMRRLLSFWLRGPISKEGVRASRLPAKKVNLISERLCHLGPLVPREFVRKPRSVAELDRWKATEFRQLLLYTGPVVFPGILPENVYNHFMLLSVGITILCSPKLCLKHNDYASSVLLSFVEQCKTVYNEGFLVYNVHNLVHLSADVKLHGPLDSFSAFPFENHLKSLKHMVRKAAFPLPQIVRRIGEKQTFQTSHRLSIAIHGDQDSSQSVIKGQHVCGPLPDGYEGAEQFTSYIRDNLFLSVGLQDGCIAVGNMIPVTVCNILQWKNVTLLVCNPFKSFSDLFSTPLPSSSLGIYKASSVSSDFMVIQPSDVVAKYVCLKMPTDLPVQSEEFALLPLLHSWI